MSAPAAKNMRMDGFNVTNLLQYKAPDYSGPWKSSQFPAIDKARDPFGTCIDSLISPSGGPS
jgi:hypothetical protein